MKVWVCKFDNRPLEAWDSSADPEKDILRRDIAGGYFEKEYLEVDRDPDGNPRSFFVDDWCSGELVEVYES